MKRYFFILFIQCLFSLDCIAQDLHPIVNNLDCEITTRLKEWKGEKHYPKVKIDNVVIEGLKSCCVLEDTYLSEYNGYIAIGDEKPRKLTKIQYYDGFGNPTIMYRDKFVSSSNELYDVCSYDALGRKKKVWNSLCSNINPISDYVGDGLQERGATMTFPWDFVSPKTSERDLERKSIDVYREDRAMQECFYDEMGRLVYTTTSGDDWVDLGASFHVRGVKTEYITNESMSVIKYSMNKSGGVDTKNISYYPPLTLTGTKVTDEDGKTIETYKDMFDNVVLERRDGNNDTYYVYKDGLLRVVVPPLFQEKKEASLLYKYKYDGLGRCVEKTLPGCQPIKYWYDMHGRMAFMQDYRMKVDKKYRFYLYDGLGRLVVQGMCTGGAGTVDSTYAAKVFYGSGGKQVDNSNYYVDTMYQLDNPSLEVVNYYDGYDCVNTAAFSNAKSTWNLKSKSDVCTSSLQTAQIVTDNKGNRYYRVMYYDKKGRCVETNSTSVDDYFIKTNTYYSFTDKIVKNITKLYRKNLETLENTVVDSIEYTSDEEFVDKQYLTFGNDPTEMISDNQYDGLGRLVESKSNNGNIRDLYEYDLHGWLTSHQNYDDRIYYMPMFKEKLYYADGPNSKSCYNGNISAQVYSDADNYSDDKGYLFGYDGMDRMTSAKFKAGSSLNKNPRVDYSEEVTYNANGSVLTMRRKGNENRCGFVDDLAFTYSGNRLFKVSDSAFDVSLGESAGFVDGYEFGVKSGQSGYRSDYDQEYSYDGCGSLTSDKNKGVLNIRYDFNGMPVRVLFENGNITEYVYTADGVKLKTIHRTAVDGIVTYSNNFELTERETLSKDSTVYVGSFEMNSSKDKMYHFANGYIDIEQGHVKAYCYYAKDHLGNVRHVDMANPRTNRNEIVQVNNYYPFGGIIDEGSRRGADVQNHLYSGKEYDCMHGLNLYDFSARQYDAAIGQFTSVDPLCEKYYHISPYAYCAGNPVKYVDPDGKKPRIYIDTKGLGHTFVTVGEGKNTVVYTYGRYGALGSSGSVLGSFTPTGEGVLFRKTGQAAATFLSKSMKNGRMSIYTINNADDKSVSSYFDKQWETGTRSTATEKKAATDPTAKVVDEYCLWSNNCTTKSIDAINSGKKNEVVPSEQTIVRFSCPDNIPNSSVEKIYAPDDLNTVLRQYSKKNPNDIIRISNPQEFIKDLIRKLK